MSLFDLYPEADDNQLAEGLLAPNKPAAPTSLFSGITTAIPGGIGSGSAKVVAPLVAESGADILGALSPTPDTYVLGNERPTDDPKQALADRRSATAEYVRAFQPDARTNGAVSNFLFQTTDLLSRALATAAISGPAASVTVPSVIGGTEGYNTMLQMRQAGVDQETANRLGVVTGALNYAGAAIPIFGKNLASQLTSGAIGNVAFGAASRGSTAKILNDAGYPQMAEQYHWLDAQDMLADTVLGLAYGGIHHAFAPGALDAAMGAKDQVHAEVDVAPGIPATPQARADHDFNLRTALTQKLNDEDVQGMRPVETVPNPAQDASREAAVRSADQLAGYAFGERVEAPRAPERAPETVEAPSPPPESSALSRAGRKAKAEQSVDDMIAGLPPDVQDMLLQARQTLRDREAQELPVENEDGTVTTAADGMKQALDDIESAKDNGMLHQIAAACGWG